MSTVTASAVPVGTLNSSLPAGPRPKPPGALAASAAFGWRAMLKIKHVPEQLFDVTIFPIMMTLMFTYLFGGALAGSTRAYLQFFLPGIMVQSVLFITMYTGVGLNIDSREGHLRSVPVAAHLATVRHRRPAARRTLSAIRSPRPSSS